MVHIHKYSWVYIHRNTCTSLTCQFSGTSSLTHTCVGLVGSLRGEKKKKKFPVFFHLALLVQTANPEMLLSALKVHRKFRRQTKTKREHTFWRISGGNCNCFFSCRTGSAQTAAVKAFLPFNPSSDLRKHL